MNLKKKGEASAFQSPRKKFDNIRTKEESAKKNCENRKQNSGED